MPYKANRGGKAPIHLRDAFCRYLDVPIYYPINLKLDTVKVGKERKVYPMKWLVGQLWNCTQILPPKYCNILHLGLGTTYAKAVRRLSADSDVIRI